MTSKELDIVIKLLSDKYVLISKENMKTLRNLIQDIYNTTASETPKKTLKQKLRNLFYIK